MGINKRKNKVRGSIPASFPPLKILQTRSNFIFYVSGNLIPIYLPFQEIISSWINKNREFQGKNFPLYITYIPT